MKYTPQVKTDDLYNSIEPVAQGLGMVILELSIFRQKGRGGKPGSVQIKVTVYKNGNIGVDDCSRFHKAVLPRLELTFHGSDVYLEVSSPGINRLIKDGNEMVHFINREIKCYCADIEAQLNAEKLRKADGAYDSGWIRGILKAADEKGIILETENEKIVLPYEKIAKAKLE